MCKNCNDTSKKYVDFVHIHNHSHFSLLDGLSSVEDLVETAASLNYKAMGLTDHGTCAGLYDFQKECKGAGIKPILGAELYITKDHLYKEKDAKTNHILLLAKNKTGLKNLFKLSTIAELEGKYRKPRIDHELLKKHHEGLICTSGCPIGEIPVALSQNNDLYAAQLITLYKEIFGDDFYFEIMMHKYFNNKEQEKKERELAKKLYQLGKKFDIKCIATNDIHYSKKDHFKYHDILLSMQTGDTIKNPERFTFDSDEFYIKSYDEMYVAYKSAPELLTNTLEISDKVECGLMGFHPDLLPRFECPEGYASENDYLKALVKDGMVQKKLIDVPEYRERIKFEMQSIIKCGYTRYFLILWDIINFAKQNNIKIGAGRGSAVGSLCLYVLGITKLDPIKYGLLFERFINPERISPPDVDIDFDYYRRDEVFDYINRKYGQEHCSKIGTYNSFRAKAVIRYATKALDLGNDWEYQQKMGQEGKNSLRLSDEIAKQIDEGPNISIESSLKDNEKFRATMQKFPSLLEASMRIEGKLSSAGVHAAGIVVCKDPIIEHIPLRESNGVICSQFNKEEVEELGLLKFDCLALKTITVMENAVKTIKERYGRTIDLDSLEPNDPKVFALFNGKYDMDNRGIFQFESAGMMRLLKDVRVDNINDMIVCNALYRPGPLGAGVQNLYCDYKHGRKKVSPLHPKMGEILGETYGIICYQEDFMKIAQQMAGFTKGQSDLLRKAVGKKKAELLKEQKDLFVNGCVKNGIQQDIAEKIFEQIDYFGGYGFNKSHSAAYAYIAYQTAWLKYYYPLEFMCHLLSSELGNEDKLKLYLQEARRMRIEVRDPNINMSGDGYKIEKGKTKDGKDYYFLRTPLTAIKGIGDKAVESVIASQPFDSFKDFLRKIDARRVNRKVFASLVDAGCMDDIWHMARPEMIERYEEVKKVADKEKAAIKKQEKEQNSMGGGSLFDKLDNSIISL